MSNLSSVAWLPPAKRVLWDQFGLYALFLLLILNPFHFYLFDKTVYYRELFAAIYILLIGVKLYFKGINILYRDKNTSSDIFIIIFFPLLLIAFALVDPGRNLYGSDISEASLHLKSINPDLYVLRNNFLYIPMVVYFALRGLAECEIRRLALIIVVIAPISVFSYLYHEEIATIFTLPVLAKLGGAKTNYNSYIPYLTFPVLSAIYLINTDSHKIIKLLAFCSLVILSTYILLSTSRQSVLFVIFCLFVFTLYGREYSLLKRIIFLLIFTIATLTAFHQLTKVVVLKNKGEIALHKRLKDRYTTLSGATGSPRWQIAKDGLAMLESKEYFIGTGLSSVINSGPHTDYVRWLQRIGVFVMLFGFAPFFMAALRAYPGYYNVKKNSLILYLFLAITFTLYHSLFGYPREDAYQAMYCFLGVAMWLGMRREIMFIPVKKLFGCRWPARFINSPKQTI